MKYLIMVILATAVLLGGCHDKQPAPTPGGGSKADTSAITVPTGDRLPPPVEYDER